MATQAPAELIVERAIVTGSVPYTLSTFLASQLRTPEWFGAVVGEADSTVAFTKMIAALNRGDIKGFRINAVYNVNATFTITANGAVISFDGVADAYAVVQLGNRDTFVFQAVNPALTNDAGDLKGITLKNPTVWYQPAPTAGRAFVFNKCHRMYIDNMDVRNTFQGVDIIGGGETFIDGISVLSGYQWTAQMPGSFGMRFAASPYGGGGRAISIPTAIEISNYDIYGNTNTVAGVPDNALEHAIITQALDGVWFSNGHCGFAYNSDLYLNPQAAANTFITDLKFTGGYFDGNFCTGQGVTSGGSASTTVSGIYFDNCVSRIHGGGAGGHGVNLNSGVPITDFQWRGGAITGNSGYGFIGANLIDPVVDALIQNNNLSNTSANGVDLSNITRGRVACSVVGGTTPHAVGIHVGANCPTLLVEKKPMAGNTIDYTIDTSSKPSFTTPVRVALRYTILAGQSIPNTTSTTLTTLTKDYDQNNDMVASTGVFTAPIAGVYDCYATAAFSATFAAGSNCGVRFVKNGTVIAADVMSIGASTINPQSKVKARLQLAAGDTIVVAAAQTSGAAVALAVNAATNYVEISQVG